MSNVPVRAPPGGPTAKAQALAEQSPDAGLKSLDHYARKLPRWRHALRQSLLPIVRWETPYLAKMQEICRTTFLDQYFALTANLGTHTFFMTALPICFWCGYTENARALVHMLALGVFWSGFVKDMLCLPRPLSPPLKRITMSHWAALEYGFPSTHSTNAVSVAAYFLYHLHMRTIDCSDGVQMIALSIGYLYAVSIVLGRLYCGMHGFSDVIIGGALGGLLAVLELVYQSTFDAWIIGGTWVRPAVTTVMILSAVRFHPEPADNCPCFDDSVAFAGVLIGIEVGNWHFAGSEFSLQSPVPATVPFELEHLGWPITVLRIVLGVVIVFLWRAATKPILLRCLPPIFRLVERLGLSLPRRFFTRASQYKRVPPLRRDDNVIPSAQDIPGMISSSLRNRRRAISVGPQSEADAREFIAYREKQRRDSRSVTNAGRPRLSDLPSPLDDSTDQRPKTDKEPFPLFASEENTAELPSKNAVSPFTLPTSEESTIVEDGQEEDQDREIFMALPEPRVRYDVEVITKLVVYAGIAWLAVEGNPILFELSGLGMGTRPT